MWNLYTYTSNRPILMTDPSGKWVIVSNEMRKPVKYLLLNSGTAYRSFYLIHNRRDVHWFINRVNPVQMRRGARAHTDGLERA